MSLDQFSLSEQIALVTGASSGIGYVLAKGLAAAGATVVAAARRKDRLGILVDEITTGGGNAIAVGMDVSSRSSVSRAFDEAEKNFGIIDTIVNNAGISDPKNFLKIDDTSRDSVMGTNFNGVWNVAQEGARRMVAAAKSGSIINISSVMAFGVQRGQASYCSSKGAVIQLTRAMAIDLMRHNIRVNSIAPGWFKTELSASVFDTPEGLEYIKRMPAQRLGNLDELVGPTILLASTAGSFVNGTVISVDGALGAMVI